MDKIKRRRYLIDPVFQLTFTMNFCIIVIISSSLIGGLVFFLTRTSTTVAIENTRVFVKPTSDFILPILILTVVVISVFSSIVALIWTLFTTHKIAGPVFRLKREVELMKEGDMNRNFGLRKKDQLRELAQSLTEMTGNFRNKHTELNEAYGRILRYLEERDFCISQDNKQEFNAMLNEMGDTLKYFKV